MEKVRDMESVRLLADHGTINCFADSVLSTKNYLISEREDHWLGKGIYFFENDKEEAFWWASNTKRKNRNKGFSDEELKQTVLINNILVERDKFYDDTTTTNQKFLESFIDENKELLDHLTVKFENNNINDDNVQNIIRGNLIFAFCKINNYDVAKCTFLKPRKLSDKIFSERERLGFVNITNQICVYNKEVIDFSSIYKEVLK